MRIALRSFLVAFLVGLALLAGAIRPAAAHDGAIPLTTTYAAYLLALHGYGTSSCTGLILVGHPLVIYNVGGVPRYTAFRCDTNSGVKSVHSTSSGGIVVYPWNPAQLLKHDEQAPFRTCPTCGVGRGRQWSDGECLDCLNVNAGPQLAHRIGMLTTGDAGAFDGLGFEDVPLTAELVPEPEPPGFPWPVSTFPPHTSPAVIHGQTTLDDYAG